MKHWLKQISFGLLCVFGLFYMTSFHVLADEDKSSNKSGEMRLKIERIGENENSDENKQDNIETELEKKFPNLFQEETKATIKLKQDATDNSTKELQQQLFEQPSEADTVLKDMKQSLFSSDYVATVTTSNQSIDDSDTGPMSNKFLAGLSGLIGMLSVGAYMLVQYLSE